MKCSSIVLSNSHVAINEQAVEPQLTWAKGCHSIDAAWFEGEVDCGQQYFSLQHAQYFESAGFEPYFLKVEAEGKELMKLICYASPITIQEVTQNLNNDAWWLKKLYRVGLKVLGADKQILICGHPHMIGDLGFVSAKDLLPEDQANLLSWAIRQLQKESSCPKLAVIKEFTDKRWESVNMPLFQNFRADNNYVLPIDKSWKSYEDYLANLVSKYRTKLKATEKKVVDLEVRPLVASEILEQQERITSLYKAVLSNANFYLGHVKAAELAQMQAQNPNRFFVNGIFDSENSLRGFFTAWKTNDQIDAFLVGMDYELVGTKQLYQYILNGYVKLGISQQVSRIVFGRTGGLAKSSIGAFPEVATCFITHKSRLVRWILRSVFRYVKPSAYDYRNPWKKELLADWEQSNMLTQFQLPQK